MVARAGKFTPQVLLSAPRRSAGIPNPIGTLVLYTISTYSFETHLKSVEVRVLNVESGESRKLSEDDSISDLNWLDNETFACLQGGKDGTTHIIVASINALVSSGSIAQHGVEGHGYYVAGTINASAANLKVKPTGEGSSFAVVFSALASPDGSLYNAEKAKPTHSTGRLYTKLFVRHWDRYETKERDALWYAKLSKSDKLDRLQLSHITNAIPQTGLECPISTFGGTDNFDISASSIIFVAKDPEVNPALNTKCNTYLLHIHEWSQWHGSAPQVVEVSGFEGAASSPCFNADGSKAAFLKMKANGYESDKNHIFVLENLTGHESARVVALGSDAWNRSPASVSFAADGSSLVVTAEDTGTGKVFLVSGRFDQRQPRPLTRSGYISDARPLLNGQIFVSGSSAIDNSYFAIIEPLARADDVDSLRVWSHSNSSFGNKFGLKLSQVSSIWTPASNSQINEEIQSIVVKPSHFESQKKYPVAYLIHGGPQGSWADNWSTRWNLAVFAEQGYIVIAPNPTGSTGYGQDFTDAIRRNWGGDPYEDIVNVFEWVGKNLPEADNENAVALGASYGGYMMNWIQGHDLGRKFKCLVCHDGITSFTGGMLPTEELYFPLYDLGGTPWYNPGFKPAPGDNSIAAQAHRNFGASSTSSWTKWDPSRFFSNWATPQLVIHSEKDYRLTIAEGLAAFNVLQARGIESQLLTFPDENHWVLKPENSLVWHKVVLNWINKFTGLPAFAEEAVDSPEFLGGARDSRNASEPASMPGQGKPET